MLIIKISIWLWQGKIACANVLSDLYAMGVTDTDNMMMLLGVSNKMSEKERDIVVPMMMRGFKVSGIRTTSHHVHTCIPKIYLLIDKT